MPDDCARPCGCEDSRRGTSRYRSSRSRRTRASISETRTEPQRRRDDPLPAGVDRDQLALNDPGAVDTRPPDGCQFAAPWDHPFRRVMGPGSGRATVVERRAFAARCHDRGAGPWVEVFRRGMGPAGRRPGRPGAAASGRLSTSRWARRAAPKGPSPARRSSPSASPTASRSGVGARLHRGRGRRRRALVDLWLQPRPV